jgi:hypothetical protein
MNTNAADIVMQSGLDTTSEAAFQLENVEYLTQRDNINAPLSSCFNTSNAMCIQYCLDIKDKLKEDIGCSSSMQLEDYIFEFINGTETTEYIKQHSSLGNLISSSKRRLYFDIECFAFNHLMNPLGFEAFFYDNLSYDQICFHLYDSKLPGIIGGNFKSVSSVEGHMNCLLGYNRIGLQEFIVHDPYGDALTGYSSTKGEYKHYGTRFYLAYKCYRVILIQKV